MRNLKSMESLTAAECAEYENVNGFKLSLKVDESGPKAIKFTITYKNNKIKCNWSRFMMIITLILYAGSYIYTYMTMKSVFVCAIIIFVLLMFWAKRTVKSESLTVIPTVGLQSSVKYIIGQEERFVPWSNIDDVIINEVIKMNRVLYFLSVLVKRKNSPDSGDALSVLPLFQYTKPRLQMIEKIYSDISQVIAKQLESYETKPGTKKEQNDDTQPKTTKFRDHGDEIVNERKYSGDIHEDIG